MYLGHSLNEAQPQSRLTHQVVVDKDLPVAVEVVAASADVLQLRAEHPSIPHPGLCPPQPLLHLQYMPAGRNSI